ncbi:MAG: hypothetical protein WCG01_04890 [bacterium]
MPNNIESNDKNTNCQHGHCCKHHHLIAVIVIVAVILGAFAAGVAVGHEGRCERGERFGGCSRGGYGNEESGYGKWQKAGKDNEQNDKADKNEGEENASSTIQSATSSAVK